jgi:hypothetical protein
MGVLAADDLVDEAPVAGEIVESTTPRISRASATAFLKWPWARPADDASY